MTWVKSPRPEGGAGYAVAVAGPLSRLSPSRAAALQACALMALALVVRLWIAPRYYGWEEGDYGNVMMIREVLESSFTWFRPSHMPGWYSLGALSQLVWGDPRGSALAMTMLFSVMSVGAGAWLGRRLAGPGAGWLVGLWLALQPEMALYGASTLRSPVFTSLGLLGLLVLLRGRRDSGFLLTAAAFLTRMEAFFVFFLPALFAWVRERGAGLRRVALPLAILGGVVIGWQLYVTVGHDETGPFWSGPMGQNQTEHDSRWMWFATGLHSSWALLSWTLPRKIGWIWMTLAGIGGLVALRGHGRPGARAVLVYAVFTLGFWLAEGFLAHHEPNHNLYWVWLMPVLPPLALLAGVGWSWLDERLVGLGRPARGLALLLVIAAALPAFVHEARYQMQRSEAWYRPQLELSHWLEANARSDAGMVLGSIPEVWLQRQPHGFRVSAWWFLPQRLKHEPPERFGQFLVDERIDYVMWFAESWTEAPAIAPYLADGEPVTVGTARLVPVDREDGYGWIFYVVERPGETPPPRPPAYGQGAPGPGWGT